MRISEIAKAIKDMTKAAHERISGQRFRRRSISQRHTQCRADPGTQPATSCANCARDLPLTSNAYAATLPSSVISLTDANLVAIEKRARAYYESISRGGLVPDSAMRCDLTDQAYLASVGCMDLLAEIRRLRALLPGAGESPGAS